MDAIHIFSICRIMLRERESTIVLSSEDASLETSRPKSLLKYRHLWLQLGKDIDASPSSSFYYEKEEREKRDSSNKKKQKEK